MIKILLAFLAGVAIGLLVFLIWYDTKVVEVSDKQPAQDSMVANAMQLSNELKDYVYAKDGKVCIRVVKK